MTDHRTATDLRFAARCAFLDGRTAQARKLNRQADKLDAATRTAQ